MKKIVSLILIACMILSFAGCSSSGKETLKVAISPDFAPMEFVDTTKTGQDKYVGFDVSLAKFIAEELGMELEIMPMSFDACQVAVQTGSVDMSISGFSWTEDRAANYNLSDYYYAGENETEQVIITIAANADAYPTAESFSGKKVAAQNASLQLELCKSQLPADCEIVEVGDLTTAFLQLQNGDFDALAVAKGQADVFIANNPGAIAICGFEFEVDAAYEANVIMLPKGADELTAKVNEILAKAYAAGYYGEWYAEALELAGAETSVDVSYDDDGNVAG
ncbi:MAG: transporter substrate-binding domain-containing protein [Oscillospiraceae bacterium]|nr:transporter substrate-binding domain-containing protein [Oscillospiraceae bacterium]